jgi:hypothetical protein
MATCEEDHQSRTCRACVNDSQASRVLSHVWKTHNMVRKDIRESTSPEVTCLLMLVVVT